MEITAVYPAGKTATTAENLLAAAEGEKEEWGSLYPGFAETGDEEGFPEVAESFREIAEAIGSRPGLLAVSIPADVPMLPGYFG